MHPWMTARLVEQRRHRLDAASPPSHSPARGRHGRRPGLSARLRGWLDRAVPAEAGVVRVRARRPA